MSAAQWRRAMNRGGTPPRRTPLPGGDAAKPTWMSDLDKVAEGQQHTLGAYHRPWK